MIEEDRKKFFDVIKKGPSFLFLGQNYLQNYIGEDYFLTAILKKYGNSDKYREGYSAIFNSKISENPEDSVAWAHGLSQRISVPSNLEKISQFNWSGLYSSAIDDLIFRAFQSDWRNIDPIFTRDRNPEDPRNRVRLHCTFLFGNISRIEKDEVPPLKKSELTIRKQVAIQLLSRLPSQITPRGSLVVESYDPSLDWLKIEDFIPVLHSCIQNHIPVFFFSATDDLINNDEINEINKDCTIKFFKENLFEIFIRGEQSNDIDLGAVPQEESINKFIDLDSKILEIPPKIWNQVSESANIIDDAKLDPPSHVSKEVLYQEFRHFISSVGSQLNWSGFLRGFAFNREYENELFTIVNTDIKSKIRGDPIILSGQTGTGKTVALKHLAIKIRKEKSVPVLFIERKTLLPKWDDIDLFCRWAEENNAPTTLIIWDGMISINNYQDLLKYLIGRGRKVSLVGSYYKVDEDEQEIAKEKIVNVPSTLQESEIKPFLEYIEIFDPSFTSDIKTKEELFKDESFLVALYRLLPSSRLNIRLGIQNEVRVSESLIKSLSINQLRQSNYNLLAYSLQQVDEQILRYIEDLKENCRIGDETVDPIQHLIGLIMIPGKFAITVPLELLTRTLNKFGYVQFFEILDRIDIFECEQDNIGNFYVGPRHPLEAKIYCSQKFGGPRTEIGFVLELIDGIQSDDISNGEIEIFFVVSLVHQIGPNGPEGSRYLEFYLELVDSLTKLRKDRQIFSPELILQEATLQREYVKQKILQGANLPNAEKILIEASNLLKFTIQRLKHEGRSPNYQNLLLCEFAANTGTLANYSADHSIKGYDFLTAYHEISTSLNKVLSWAANDEHALDSFIWISRDLITRDVFNPQKKAEVISDVLSAIDTSESGGFEISDKILARKMQIYDLIGEDVLADEVFNKLKSRDSCAGYYLRAFYPIRMIPNNREYSGDERNLLKIAVNFLEENRKIIKNDAKCLRLLFYSWWKMRTGTPLFFKERQVLDFKNEDWLYVLGILLDLQNLGQLESNPSLMYINGVTHFHLNEIQESKRIFSDIEKATYGMRGIRRITVSYLVSNPEGTPKKFYGEVQWIDKDRNRGEVYVPILRTIITFFPKEFHQMKLIKGESLGDFHIGFNFINPLVDPISYSKKV